MQLRCLERRVPIEKELLPLLRVMHAEAGGHGRVVRIRATDRKLSLKLRRCLEIAGIVRSDLFHERTSSGRPRQRASR